MEEREALISALKLGAGVVVDTLEQSDKVIEIFKNYKLINQSEKKFSVVYNEEDIEDGCNVIYILPHGEWWCNEEINNIISYDYFIKIMGDITNDKSRPLSDYTIEELENELRKRKVTEIKELTKQLEDTLQKLHDLDVLVYNGSDGSHIDGFGYEY